MSTDVPQNMAVRRAGDNLAMPDTHPAAVPPRPAQASPRARTVRGAASSVSPSAVEALEPGEVGDALARSPRGIQSVEVGGQLLQVLARSGRRMALGELARAAGMPPAKAHPYLVSYGKLGLVEQDAVSGHYGLGPLTVQLGLIGLQQVDPVRLAIGELPALAQRVGHTVSASVWGDGGPTIIRVEEAPTAVYVAMRHGTTASVRQTASGKVFAAFSARERIAAALAADGHAGALDDPDFAAELDAVRAQRLSVVHNQLLSGISALAAPVFDGFGHLVLALSVIGPSATLSVDPAGLPAQSVRHTARMLSERLGFSG